jgi:aminotransferase
VHDFLTVGAAAPLQEAGAVALGLPDEYYAKLAREYQRRRDVLLDILERHHFTCFKPDGAYYIMTDIRSFGFKDDVEFARYLVKDVGVGTGAGEQLLQDVERRAHQDPLLFLQRRRNVGGSGSPPGQARRGRSLTFGRLR